MIELPKRAGGADDLGLDLGTLEAIESAGEAVVFERRGKPMTLKEAQAAAAASTTAEAAPVVADPKIRTCPKCRQKVRSDDIYCDLICRHCGTAIPGIEAVATDAKARYSGSMADRIKAPVTFYTGFSTAMIYPLPAMVWILLGMGIALATIAVPLLAVLAFTAGSGLNPIAEKQDFGWVSLFLTVMFAVQGVYFGSVAYYILIDTIRTTTSGGEQPPSLTWNIINLGAALGGYAALIGFYLVVILLLLLISNGQFPSGREDLSALSRPANLIVLALLTFGVPMNMIGLSSSHAMDGLNPMKVFRSMGRTLGHYIFLFLIVLLYLGIYIGGIAAVMSWAGPAIVEAAQKGLDAGLLRMLGGPAAWSVLIGLGFYFAYSIGRILGLFCRTYRESLEFDL
jgi:hypothetical protein